MVELNTGSTVLVPWDFSHHATAALNYALEQVSVERIRVVCVLERPNLYTPGVFWGEESESKARSSCEEEFATAFDSSQHPELKFDVVFGDPPEEIVRCAQEEEDPIILISTHGHSGVKKLIMGSVAQRILQIASCPILLLPNAWFEETVSGTEEVQSTDN